MFYRTKSIKNLINRNCKSKYKTRNYRSDFKFRNIENKFASNHGSHTIESLGHGKYLVWGAVVGAAVSIALPFISRPTAFAAETEEESNNEGIKHSDSFQNQILAKIKSALSFDPILLQEAVDNLWSFILNSKDDIAAEPLDLRNLLSHGRIDEAIANLSLLIEKDRGSKVLYKYMALSYILKEKYDEALYFLNEAIWVDNLDADLYYHKGNILQKKGDISGAIVCFEKAFLLNPNLTDAKELSHNILKTSGFDINHYLYNYLLGVVNYDLGRYDDAIFYYEKALLSNPDHIESLYNLDLIRKIKMNKYTTPVPSKLLPIVTIYEYAAMSEAAYSDSKSVVPSSWEILTTSNTEVDVNGNFSRDGFFSCAYVNHNKKHVVLAIQGTKATEDLISSSHLVFNQLDRQWICAKKFAERVINRVKNDPSLKDYEITFTGHSLGAAQAEFLSYLFDIKAVTFESPGSLEIIHSYNGGKYIDPSKIKSIGYLSRPNIINTAKTHVGKVYRIYTPLPSKSIKAENAELLLQKLDSFKKLANMLSLYGIKFLENTFGNEVLKMITESELMINETEHWHSMINICQAFRHEYDIGYQPILAEVVKWPLIDHFYLYWRITRECNKGDPDLSILGEINKEALSVANYEVKPVSRVVKTSELTKDELQFLKDYKRNPTQYSPYLNEIERNILDLCDVGYYEININSGISIVHWKDFISKKTKDLKPITKKNSYQLVHIY